MEEGANLFRHFRAEGVFNFGGVLVHHIRINSESLEEQAFGKAMPPQHVAGASLTARGEGKGSAFELNQTFLRHQLKCGAVAREFRQGIRFQPAAARILPRVPDGLQQVFDQLLFILQL